MENFLSLFFLPLLTSSLNFTYTPSFDSNFLSTGFLTPDGVPWNDTNIYPYGMGDVNGDGRADIVGFGGNNVYVSLSNGTHFLTPTIWLTGCYTSVQSFFTQDNTPRWVYDINGDGKADILGFSSTAVYASLSTGSSFSGCTIWCNNCFTGVAWVSISARSRTVFDYNGDGKGDISGITNTGTTVIPSTGTSFVNPYAFCLDSYWNSQYIEPRFFADINGDGKGDIIGFKSSVAGVYVFIGNGSYCNPKQLWTSGFGGLGEFYYQNVTPRYIGDFDGDGKDDILGIAPSGIYIEFSQGYILSPKALVYNYSDDNGSFLDNSKSYKLIGDIDGDGKDDIVAITNTGNGIKAYTSKSSHIILDIKCSLCPAYNTSCSACINRPVYLINGTMSCPPGTSVDTTFLCNSLPPYLLLSLYMNGQISCDFVYIYTTMRQNETIYYTPINYFSWFIRSNSTNITMSNLLFNNIASQTGSPLMIPMKFLERNIQYTVLCSYLDPLKLNVSNTTTFYIDENNPLIPKFTITAETLTINQRDIVNIMNADVYQNQCMNISSPFVYIWNQTSGPAISPAGLNQHFTFLEIEPCAFDDNKTYTYQAIVMISGYFQFSSTKNFSITTALDLFAAKIKYIDRSHPYDQPIDLKGVFERTVNCDRYSSIPITYSWTCMVAASMTSTYSSCSDPNILFGTNSLNSNLSIPNSYFSQGNILIIGLSIAYGSRVLQTAGYIYVSGKDTLILEVSCLNPPCIKYNSLDDLYLQVKIQNDPMTGYAYEWNLNLPFVNVAYKDIFYTSGDTRSYTGYLNIIVDIKSSKYSGTANFSLPINFPPINGTLSVTPGNGESFKTNFLLDCQYWTDPDIPLGYSFYYKINDTLTPLSNIQANSFTNSYLPGAEHGIPITIIANIQDFYRAISIKNKTILVYSTSKNLSDALSYMNSYVKSISIANSKTISQVSMISSEILNFQNDLLELRKNVISCTGCGSQPICLLGQCICRDTTLNQQVDCSITQKMIDQTNDLNQLITQTMIYSYKNSSSSLNSSSENTFMENNILTAIKKMMQNPEFVTKQQVTSYLDILDNTLDILNPNKILTPGQISVLAQVVDEILNFIGKDDCNCSTVLCKELENKTHAYFDKMSDDSLRNKIPGQPPTTINTNSFDLVTLRTTACNASSITLNASSNSPLVTLEPVSTLDCNQVIDISYYTMQNNSQIFNCNNTDFGSLKNTLMLKIVDPVNKKSLANLFNVKVVMPPGYDCPAGCTLTSSRVCFCKIDLFDVSTQLSQIFKSSSLSAFQNVGAISDWDWKTSPIFWVNLGTLLWFGATIIIVSFLPGVKKYCLLSNIENGDKIKRTSALAYSFLVLSNLTNIYMVKKSNKTKTIRALMYYLRVVLYSTFSAIFSSSGVNESLLLLLKNMQLYVILLPYWTVLPIHLILSNALIGKTFAKEKNPKFTILQGIILLIFISITGGCIFAMFIIAANKSTSAQFSWMVYFFFSLAQEIFIFPLLTLMFQIFIIRTTNVCCISRISNILKDENLELIYSKTSSPLPSKSKIYPVRVHLNKAKSFKQTIVSQNAMSETNNNNALSEDDQNTESVRKNMISSSIRGNEDVEQSKEINYLDSEKDPLRDNKEKIKAMNERHTKKDSRNTLQVMNLKRKLFTSDKN